MSHPVWTWSSSVTDWPQPVLTQSVDKSYLSKYILNPWWTYAATFMPDWLAPNAITLIGVSGMLMSIFFTVYYTPELTGDGPRWLYFFSAISLFFYQTMDNIDGKQARRTGSSSPLGELFDHGIDSLNCTYGGIVQTAAVALGSTSYGALMVVSTCIGMYFSTWETYYTHTLYLGVVNGPTEGLVVSLSTMVISGVMGTDIWKEDAVEVLPFLSFMLPEALKLNEFWVWIVMFTLVVLHVPFCVWNVYWACKEDDVPFSEALVGLLPFAVAGGATYVWVQSPYSTVLVDNHIVLFGLTASWVFGRLTTGVILNHLTKLEFPLWNSTLIPLLGATVLFYLLPALGLLPQDNPHFETLYMWGFFTYASVNFLTWAVNTINVICSYLGIRCLSLRPIDNKTN